MAPPGPGWRSNAASVFWQTCWRPASEAHPRLAYSLAISTVNNISWYAAGGIGSTAVRFSGRYSRDSAGYRTLARVLTIISLFSSVLAALVLWLDAAPIARLLGKASLTGLLHWAALSAAGMILLECCRGFLVGQRRLPAILLLSVAIGAGMIALLPAASRLGPVQIHARSRCSLCSALPASRPRGADERRGLRTDRSAAAGGVVIRFGPARRPGRNQCRRMVAHDRHCPLRYVARADRISLHFTSVAQHGRLIPGPSDREQSRGNARGESNQEKTPDQVMAVCTLVTTLVCLLIAGLGITIVPWALTLFYGKAYAAAAATAMALATAVIHMDNSPAAARLSIVRSARRVSSTRFGRCSLRAVPRFSSLSGGMPGKALSSTLPAICSRPPGCFSTLHVRIVCRRA